MHTLTSFRRRLHASDGSHRDVEIPAGTTSWLPAQQHAGGNIGDTPTRVLFRAQGRRWRCGPADDSPGAVGPGLG